MISWSQYMATHSLPQIYLYNLWHVVASQGKHVAADQSKCCARHIANKADEQCANDNVKHIDQ